MYAILIPLLGLFLTSWVISPVGNRNDCVKVATTMTMTTGHRVGCRDSGQELGAMSQVLRVQREGQTWLRCAAKVRGALVLATVRHGDCISDRVVTHVRHELEIAANSRLIRRMTIAIIIRPLQWSVICLEGTQVVIMPLSPRGSGAEVGERSRIN